MSVPRELQMCQTCRWWNRLDDENGECRRYPPQVVQDGDAFPVMESEDWCGEWTDSLTRLAAGLDGADVMCQGLFGPWAVDEPEPEPHPVAWCIQCADDDPKVHSLSFDKAALGKIVTRHGGKVVPLYLGRAET